jgi:glucosamine-6-phosphate deaminase
MVYEELVRMHREEGLSFNVITFNLDEYYPMRVDNKAIIFYASAPFDH